jgi:hypothetical protein
VPCGKRKIWDKHPDVGPTEARRVYVGPFASRCQLYAERYYPEGWFILSAKYGFLAPKDIVPERYDVTFNNKRTNPIGPYELIRQAENRGLSTCDEVVVLGGERYRDILGLVFAGKPLINPLIGCKGMGEMMNRLDRLTLDVNDLPSNDMKE